MSNSTVSLDGSKCAMRSFLDGMVLIADEVFDVMHDVYRDYFKSTEMYVSTLASICKYEKQGHYELAMEFILALSILMQEQNNQPYIKINAFTHLNTEGEKCFIHEFCEKVDSYYGLK